MDYASTPQTEITILRDKVESQIGPLSPTMGRFKIRTPQAKAGVSGTHFRVGLLANGIVTNELLSGILEVSRHRPETGIILRSGQNNTVNASKAGPPVVLLAAP